jgi:Icc-related predicted phosphoesterase
MARIVLISDIHGNLVDIPPCDLLLIAGDLVPKSLNLDKQLSWFDTTFRYWLRSLPAKNIVGIAGNHDFLFQERPSSVPDLPWHYLQDSSIEVAGFKIYGTPWQRPFHDWAFNAKEDQLREIFAKIPDDTDIVVSHSPPFGIGDGALRSLGIFENAGSSSLMARILEVKPILHVFGHIHEGRGQYDVDGIKFVNAAIVGQGCVHPPTVLEIVPRCVSITIGGKDDLRNETSDDC